MMGVRRGALASLWILKFSAKKGCFLSFEREKLSFNNFGSPRKNPRVAPLERFLPTPKIMGEKRRFVIQICPIWSRPSYFWITPFKTALKDLEQPTLWPNYMVDMSYQWGATICLVACHVLPVYAMCNIT